MDLTWAGAVGKRKKCVGEKILPGERRKSLCSDPFSWGSYLPCPPVCCTSTNSSNSACQKLESTAPLPHAFPFAWHAFLSPPFLSLSHSSCQEERGARKKPSTEHCPHGRQCHGRLVRNFQRGWQVVPNAEEVSEDGH